MAELFDAKIKQRTFIAVSPQKVYETITSGAGWDTFFTTGMTLDLKPGGACNFKWKEWGPDKYSFEAPGKVVAFTPNEMFSFQWGSAGKETTITFLLEPVEGGTVVTCTEEGYYNTPEGRAMMLECASGWGEALTLLKFYLEHGVTYWPTGKRP